MADFPEYLFSWEFFFLEMETNSNLEAGTED